MELENPLPRALMLVGLAIPLVLAAGFGLSALATRDRGTQRVIAPALAAALWLLAVMASARVAHGFPAGFVAGTLLCAALGAASIVARLCTARSIRLPGRACIPLVLFTVAAVVLIVPTVRLYFADEAIQAGHLSTVEQLLNGHYPPRYAYFPRFELKYHYGFDVLAAMASGLLHAKASTGIDVCTVLLWVYMAVLSGHLGRRLTGARYGVLTAAFAMLGGGFPFLCPTARASLGAQLTGACMINELQLGMPTAGYFFQHPFGLGIPLALAVLCLLADRASGPRPGRYVAFGVLLLALFVGQIVLFACLAATLAVSEGFPKRRRFERARALRMAAVLAIVVVCSRWLGGFAAPAPYHVGSLLAWHLGVGHSVDTAIRWQLRVYGLLLPLGLVGLRLLRRERLAFALLVAGCLVTPNVLRYTRSWDIVKFCTVAGLMLSICASAVVVRLARLRPTTPRWMLGARLSLAAALTAVGIAAGVGLHLAVWLRAELRPSMTMRLFELSKQDEAVLDYLRHHVGPEEIVLRRPRISWAYNQLGGLHVPWLPNAVNSFGFGPEQQEPRRQLLRTLPAALHAYVDQGITWFVLDDNDGMLQAEAAQWLRTGEVEIAFESGSLRVLHATRKP